jgi:hypothetical protein
VSTMSTLRAAYRPHGTVAATCRTCAYFDVCGGIETDRPLMNCFDLFCPGDGKCQHVCPCQPDFVEHMEEIRGLRFDNLSQISQVPLDLPFYVPVKFASNNEGVTASKMNGESHRLVAMLTMACLSDNERQILWDGQNRRKTSRN